jgi:diaminopimelate decarboxylase/aspartate kinase
MAESARGGNFLVLKFGGTSVSSADNWTRITDIVRSRLASADEGTKVVIVHSALSKVTDKLYTCLDQVLERRRASDTALGPHDVMSPVGAHRKTLAEIMGQHLELAQALGISSADADCLLAPYRSEAERILEGSSLLGEVSARTKARVVAMGELLSTTIGAAYLQLALGAERVGWLEARELLRSPSHSSDGDVGYLSAVCGHEKDPRMQRRLGNHGEQIFVTQGFIAANADGDTVLLGRGGSDTSAAYMAALLGAQRLEIWTDVPGMFTANPKLIPEVGIRRGCSHSTPCILRSVGNIPMDGSRMPAERPLLAGADASPDVLRRSTGAGQHRREGQRVGWNIASL